MAYFFDKSKVALDFLQHRGSKLKFINLDRNYYFFRFSTVNSNQGSTDRWTTKKHPILKCPRNRVYIKTIRHRRNTLNLPQTMIKWKSSITIGCVAMDLKKIFDQKPLSLKIQGEVHSRNRSLLFGKIFQFIFLKPFSSFPLDRSV